jgi:type IV pilus assembly protein PilM
MKFFSPSRDQDRLRLVEIGASHVVAAEFVRLADRRLRMELFEAESFVPSIAADASAPPELASALAKVVGIFKGRKTPVTLVIPGHLVLTKYVKIPAVAPAQREKIIQFEAQQSIPFPLDEVVWDHQIIADAGAELEVLFAAAKKGNIEATLALFERNRFDLVAVRSAGLLCSHVAEETETRHPGTTLTVVVGARSTHLLFSEGPKFFLRTIGQSGNLITRAIAETLEMSFAEAEQLKLKVLRDGFELPPDSQVAQAVAVAVQTFKEKLLGEINRSVVTHRRQHDGAELATIALVGGGADLPGLGAWLEDKLGRPVTSHDTLQGLDFAAGLRLKIDQFGSLRLGDFVGATRAWASESEAINLLPKSISAVRDSQAQRPRWLVAAALLIVTLALPGWHYARLADARLQAAAELGRRLGPVYALQDENRTHITRLNTGGAEAEVLRELGEAQVAWVGFLADLQQRLRTVQDVWLERLLILPPTEEVRSRSGVSRADDGGEDARLAPPLRLRLSGRLLDRKNPLSRVSQSSYERVTSLLSGIVESEFVTAVEGERFDASELGILRFDFTLVINPHKSL